LARNRGETSARRFAGAAVQAVLLSIYHSLKQRGPNPIQIIMAAVHT